MDRKRQLQQEIFRLQEKIAAKQMLKQQQQQQQGARHHHESHPNGDFILREDLERFNAHVQATFDHDRTTTTRAQQEQEREIRALRQQLARQDERMTSELAEMKKRNSAQRQGQQKDTLQQQKLQELVQAECTRQVAAATRRMQTTLEKETSKATNRTIAALGDRVQTLETNLQTTRRELQDKISHIERRLDEAYVVLDDTFVHHERRVKQEWQKLQSSMQKKLEEQAVTKPQTEQMVREGVEPIATKMADLEECFLRSARERFRSAEDVQQQIRTVKGSLQRDVLELRAWVTQQQDEAAANSCSKTSAEADRSSTRTKKNSTTTTKEPATDESVSKVNVLATLSSSSSIAKAAAITSSPKQPDIEGSQMDEEVATKPLDIKEESSSSPPVLIQPGNQQHLGSAMFDENVVAVAPLVPPSRKASKVQNMMAMFNGSGSELSFRTTISNESTVSIRSSSSIATPVPLSPKVRNGSSASQRSSSHHPKQKVKSPKGIKASNSLSPKPSKKMKSKTSSPKPGSPRKARDQIQSSPKSSPGKTTKKKTKSPKPAIEDQPKSDLVDTAPWTPDLGPSTAAKKQQETKSLEHLSNSIKRLHLKRWSPAQTSQSDLSEEKNAAGSDKDNMLVNETDCTEVGKTGTSQFNGTDANKSNDDKAGVLVKPTLIEASGIPALGSKAVQQVPTSQETRIKPDSSVGVHTTTTNCSDESSTTQSLSSKVPVGSKAGPQKPSLPTPTKTVTLDSPPPDDKERETQRLSSVASPLDSVSPDTSGTKKETAPSEEVAAKTKPAGNSKVENPRTTSQDPVEKSTNLNSTDTEFISSRYSHQKQNPTTHGEKRETEIPQKLSIENRSVDSASNEGAFPQSECTESKATSVQVSFTQNSLSKQHSDNTPPVQTDESPTSPEEKRTAADGRTPCQGITSSSGENSELSIGVLEMTTALSYSAPSELEKAKPKESLSFSEAKLEAHAVDERHSVIESSTLAVKSIAETISAIAPESEGVTEITSDLSSQRDHDAAADNEIDEKQRTTNQSAEANKHISPPTGGLKTSSKLTRNKWPPVQSSSQNIEFGKSMEKTSLWVVSSTTAIEARKEDLGKMSCDLKSEGEIESDAASCSKIVDPVECATLTTDDETSEPLNRGIKPPELVHSNHAQGVLVRDSLSMKRDSRVAPLEGVQSLVGVLPVRTSQNGIYSEGDLDPRMPSIEHPKANDPTNFESPPSLPQLVKANDESLVSANGNDGDGEVDESTCSHSESNTSSSYDNDENRLVSADKLKIGDASELELRRKALALLGIGVNPTESDECGQQKVDSEERIALHHGSRTSVSKRQNSSKEVVGSSSVLDEAFDAEKEHQFDNASHKMSDTKTSTCDSAEVSNCSAPLVINSATSQTETDYSAAHAIVSIESTGTERANSEVLAGPDQKSSKRTDIATPVSLQGVHISLPSTPLTESVHDQAAKVGSLPERHIAEEGKVCKTSTSGTTSQVCANARQKHEPIAASSPKLSSTEATRPHSTESSKHRGSFDESSSSSDSATSSSGDSSLFVSDKEVQKEVKTIVSDYQWAPTEGSDSSSSTSSTENEEKHSTHRKQEGGRNQSEAPAQQGSKPPEESTKDDREANTSTQEGHKAKKTACVMNATTVSVKDPCPKPIEEPDESSSSGSSEDSSDDSSEESSSKSATSIDCEDKLVEVDKLKIGDSQEVELRRRALALLGIGGPHESKATNDDGSESSSSEPSESSVEEPTGFEANHPGPVSILRVNKSGKPRKGSNSVKFSANLTESKEIPAWDVEEKIHLFYDKEDIKRFRVEEDSRKSKKKMKQAFQMRTAIDSLPSFWG